MAVGGSMTFCFLGKPDLEPKKQADQVEEDDEEVKEPNPIQDIKDTFNMMIKPKMLLCQPLIIWSGISTAIFGSMFISMMTTNMANSFARFPDDNQDYGTETGRNQTALLTMVLLGIGEIVGGQLVGTIKDKVSVKVATVFQILLLISGTALILAFNND